MLIVVFLANLRGTPAQPKSLDKVFYGYAAVAQVVRREEEGSKLFRFPLFTGDVGLRLFLSLLLRVPVSDLVVS
jgi:hypothetical protein